MYEEKISATGRFLQAWLSRTFSFASLPSSSSRGRQKSGALLPRAGARSRPRVPCAWAAPPLAPHGFLRQRTPAGADYTGPDHGGIFVYAGGTPPLARWDVVQISGADVNNFYDQVQLRSAVLEAAGGSAPLQPIVFTGAAEVRSVVGDGPAADAQP